MVDITGQTMLLHLIVVGALSSLAYWRRDILLYLLAVPAPIMLGFEWYETYPTNLGMVIAVSIGAIGLYSFYKVVENLIERIR